MYYDSMAGDLEVDVSPLEICWQYFINHYVIGLKFTENNSYIKNMNLKLRGLLNFHKNQTWELSVRTKRHQSRSVFLKVVLKAWKFLIIFPFPSLLVTLKTLHWLCQRLRFLSTHFGPISQFYILWKRQKMFSFLTFHGA